MLEDLEKYNKVIKHLGIIWQRIKQPKTDELNLEYSQKVNDAIEIIGDDKLTEDILIDSFKKGFAVYNIVRQLKDIIENNDIYQEHYQSITNFMSDNDLYELLKTNIRVFYESILGAAIVIVRTKPLQEYNTAPTLDEIFEYLQLSTNPDADKKAAGLNKFGIRDHIKMKQKQKQKQIQLNNQEGGYKYEDIFKVSSEDASKGLIKVSNLCEYGVPELYPTVKDKTYGPFAGVYTPEYNNFDIYGYLFGTQPLVKPAESTEDSGNTDYKPDYIGTVQASEKYGTLSYNGNEPQELMEKLRKGGNVVMFGYGFSGSGKTYTLLEGSGIDMSDTSRKYDPSMLELFIKDNVEYITKIEFIDIYPLGIKDPGDGNKLKRVFSHNLNNDKDIFPIVQDSYKDEKEYEAITQNITFEEITTRMQTIETHRRKHLRILATTNNPSSSRSFLQLTVHLSHNGKTNKIVFFDMPGTENTVRIRTEYLGIDMFDKVMNPLALDKKNELSNLPAGELDEKTKNIINSLGFVWASYETIIRSFLQGFNLGYKATQNYPTYIKLFDKQKAVIYLSNTTPTIYKTNTEIIINNRPEVIALKNMLFTKIILDNFFKVKNTSYNYISEVGQKLVLFLNGFSYDSLKEYAEQNESKTLYLLTIENKKAIAEYFMKNIILRKDDKEPEQYQYFAVYGKDDDKPPVDDARLLLKMTEEDKPYIEEIYGIGFNNEDKTKPSWITKQSTTPKLIDTIDMSIDLAIFDNDAIYSATSISNLKEANKYIVFKKEYPAIKYFILILNLIFQNGIDINSLWGVIVLLAYKHIDFIVRQGNDIVTTLEHLKFFFLSTTGNVDKYNNSIPDDKKEQKFLCSDSDKQCLNLVSEPRKYIDKTVIKAAEPLTGKQEIALDAEINMGNMQDYKLLPLLQHLAVRTWDLTTLDRLSYKNNSGNDEFTLNLFKTKTENPIKGTNSIFVMFTNIKIYRDNCKDPANALCTDTLTNVNDKDLKLKSALTQICTAEIDTLNFAQSISSTTQGSQSSTELSKGGSYRQYKNNKNNKKNKPKTHRNKTKRNNKNKLFARRSKKYYN